MVLKVSQYLFWVNTNNIGLGILLSIIREIKDVKFF